MNRKILSIVGALAAGVCLASPAMADEYGTLVSKTAVVGQVSVPQRQCYQQEQVVRQPQTGAGALLGALVGGGVGHAFGGGAGRVAATGIGAVAGALVGDRVEAEANPTTVADVQRCQISHQWQNAIVGYDIVYDVNGQRFSARVPMDPGQPGQSIVLNDNGTPLDVALPAVTMPAPRPVIVSAPTVVYAPPPLVVGPVVPAVGVTVGAGWGWRRWH